MLCVLCAGALIALADNGSGGGGKPKLSSLRASVTGSGSNVVVTGYVRGAKSVLARYGRDCRTLRLSSSAQRGGLQFRIQIPSRGSARRARICRAAISRRPLGPAASRSSAAKRGPVRVIACSNGLCVNHWIALRRVPSAGTAGPGGAAAAGHGPTASRVTVAPGITVPVPTPDPPVPPSVPASRFVSPSGSDSGSCGASNPCSSFNRAYEEADPGQVVDVAGGDYPTQRIEHDSSKTSDDDVYFRPAAGASVNITGDIEVGGSHVTFMAMRALDTDTLYEENVRDVTFWAMDGRNFTIDSGQGVSVIGGDYGPASDCGGPYGGSNNGIRKNGSAVPSDILIWGVDIHDIQSYDLNACHIECLIVGAGTDITVRSSRFWNCSIFDIFLQPFNGPISDVTLENNWFAAPTDPNGKVNSPRAVEFSGGGPWQNLLIRHNSVNTAINLNDGAANPQYVNSSMIGNIAVRSNPPCFSAQGVTYRDNVWEQGTCDPSDRSLGGGALPFVRGSDHGDLDYHLTGGPAVDLVPASVSDLADDIDGESRPKGAARDAGADER